MSAVRTTRAADIDLEGIWDYIACDDLDAADGVLQRLQTRFESYARQPELGESRAELGSNIRCFSVGKYVVY